MRNTPDPSIHQARERQIVEHVKRLIADERFVVDTTAGRRPVPALRPQVTISDRAAELKRMMSAMNLFDRQLQDRMPVGLEMEISLRGGFWPLFSRLVGRIRVVCVSPMQALLAGQMPQPLDLAQTRKILGQMQGSGDVPETIVLVSTSGFDIAAHEAVERTAERTVILVEPNDAGGWNCIGPAQTQALAELFDPEEKENKRQRIRQMIQSSQAQLLQGGVAADKLAARTQLPLGLVEQEVKSYARDNPGLVAKRLDGRLVLYPQGVAPPPAAGGANMPLLDRLKSLFSRKGEIDKKIAFLSERRAALAQQRDRASEQIAALEQQDQQLRNQFKESDSAITRRRITSQLVQLRKDLQRRQQMLGVLNQQIDIVSTHLHNLELTRQGQAARLPDSEQIAADAAAAEEMLAQLQAESELAQSVGALAQAGMSQEEQALYEQLEREAGGPATTKVQLDHAQPLSQSPSSDQEKPGRPAEPEAG